MDTFARQTRPSTSNSAQPSDAGVSSRYLHRQALAYRQSGYSIIPLIGDRAPRPAPGQSARSPKQPAIAWKDYQGRQPALHELDTWFLYEQHPAIGIVTGAISSLLVFDFDDPGRYEAFSAACPALIATHTVQTARGRHLYFHIAPGLTLPSRKIPGLDIQGEGRYVVAPPSSINGHRYTVTVNQPPHSLTAADIAQISAFLAAQSPPPDRALYAEMLRTGLMGVAESEERTAEAQRENRGVSIPPLQKERAANDSCERGDETPHRASLITHYTSLAAHLGSRNAALYRLSHRLRHLGHSETQTIDLLARLHADAKPLGPHLNETHDQRMAEAHRTIRSVYTSAHAPPIPTAGMDAPLQEGAVALDQALREHLLQRDLHEGTAFLRVYEGLSSQGVQPGQRITRRDMKTLLQTLGIGRPAIERALNALDTEGQPLLPSVAPSVFLPPEPPVNTDKDSGVLMRLAAPPVPPNGVPISNHAKTPTQGGRPAIQLVFPSMADLCQRLGIRPAGGGDPIQRADLASPVAYRSSLQHSFIKRRPGRYSLALLSKRLGVSKCSIQRYHTRTGVQSVPTYETVAELSLERLDDYPNELPAQFSRRKPSKFSLVDDRGRRYPARRQTAKWLLHCKRKVILMQRAPNFYWVDKPPIRALVRHQLGSYQVSSFKPSHLQEALMRLTRTLERHFERTARAADETQMPAEQDCTSPAEAVPALSTFQVIENLTRAAIWSGTEQQARQQPRLIPDAPLANSAYTAPQRPKRFYRQPLRDSGLEDLAVRVHEFTNPNKTWAKKNHHRAQNDANGLSITNARRLVELYGFVAVQKALNKAIWMQEKGFLQKRAGLIITQSRLNWREAHGNPPFDQVPQFKAEQRASRRKKRGSKEDVADKAKAPEVAVEEWLDELRKEWDLAYEQEQTETSA